MVISVSAWRDYVGKLRAINEKAARDMTEWMDKVGWGQRTVEDVIAYAAALSHWYGEAAAALACEMYDAIAEASHVHVPPAVPAETADLGEVAAAITKASEQAPSTVPSTVGRLVKQAGADTMLRNALRDGAEAAWVPNGDTCAFCIMLASNGWQRQSFSAASRHAKHIHSNCDCEYAVRFNGRGGVAGYDPNRYLEQYNAAEGGDWYDKVNSIRREQYKANGDKIREQKRIAYAERKNSQDT